MLDNWANDICYECEGYGDDYFINDRGELEWRCPLCHIYQSMRHDYDDLDDYDDWSD